MIAYLKGLGIGILCVLVFAVGLFINTKVFKDAPSEGFSFSVELQSSNKLTPTVFVSTPRFTASESLSTKINLSAEEKALIANVFTEILSRVEQESFCSGGSYSVEPIFSYEGGIQTPKGQRVEASLSCKIKTDELLSYNKLLNDIDALASKSGFITMSMPALRASFTNEELKENEKKLSEELIQKALANTAYYTKLTNKQCELINLDFSSLPIPRALSVKSQESATNFDTTLPVVSEEEHAITALVTYLCR